jgi:c(7)-type cytochrome triheme protein
MDDGDRRDEPAPDGAARNPDRAGAMHRGPLSGMPVKVLAILLCLTVAASCSRKAMSLFFDVPESPPQAGPAAAERSTSTAEVLVFAQDTIRPPIESVQDPDSVRSLLPKDAAGGIDWVAALREDVVRPRGNLPGDPRRPDMSGFAFDFLYEGPAPMFDASFPHSAHVEWLDCRTCHPAIFPYRDAEISMSSIGEGEHCGACHGPVAFPATNCQRCHAQMPGSAEPDLLGDVRLARAGGGAGPFPPALFPHWVHRIRYQCAACHPALFTAEAGADTISMAMIGEGQACGRCHDGTLAFGSTLESCNRCHVPVQAQPSEADTAVLRIPGFRETHPPSR